MTTATSTTLSAEVEIDHVERQVLREFALECMRADHGWPENAESRAGIDSAMAALDALDPGAAPLRVTPAVDELLRNGLLLISEEQGGYPGEMVKRAACVAVLKRLEDAERA